MSVVTFASPRYSRETEAVTKAALHDDLLPLQEAPARLRLYCTFHFHCNLFIFREGFLRERGGEKREKQTRTIGGEGMGSPKSVFCFMIFLDFFLADYHSERKKKKYCNYIRL